MKHLRLTAIITVFCILLACFSGCKNLTLKSVDELLRAPKLTGENAFIQNAFEAAVTEGVSLVSPLTGEYRSSYIFFDFDHDDIQEAFVFYTLLDSPDEVHMNLLDKYNDEWISMCDITGNGSEVYNIRFVNLDKDADYEFAVTWTFSDTKRTKMLSLYKYKSNEGNAVLHQISALQIMDYLVLDIDYDGCNEVFYTVSNIEKDKQKYLAAVFRIQSENSEPLPLSEVELSKNIESLLSYQYDKKAGTNVIYIDCLASDGRYFTEIICYDYTSSALVRPLDEHGVLLAAQTYRTDLLYSEDYNHDYQIEIPAQTEDKMSYYLDNQQKEGGRLTLTTYYQLTDNALTVKDRYYYNSYDDYRICINDYSGVSYMIYSGADRILKFSNINAYPKEELLFTIKYLNNNTSATQNDFDINGNLEITVTELGQALGFNRDSILKSIQPI